MKRKELKKQLKIINKKYKNLRDSICLQYDLTEYDMDCLEKYGCTRDIWDDRSDEKYIEEELPF